MHGVVVPGDDVGLDQSENLQIGPGLRRSCGTVRATVAGVLSSSSGGKRHWVDSYGKRYVPADNERVLGVVTKTSRTSKVDIGGSSLAVLPELAFEGATKRNKPNLKVGDLVYMRVNRAHRHMEPEVVCVDGKGKAAGMGVLPASPHSFLFHCSLGLCRKLLMSPCPVLEELGKHLKFECVVGMNGRVWVDSHSMLHTIAVTNALMSCEYMSSEEVKVMVDTLMKHL